MPTLSIQNKVYATYIGTILYGATPMTEQRGKRQWESIKLDPNGVYVTRDEYEIHCVDPEGKPIPLYQYSTACSMFELELFKSIGTGDQRTVGMILKWGSDEPVTRPQALAVAEEFVHRFLPGYYCVYYYHGDAELPHVHITICRTRSKDLADCVHHISPLAIRGSWTRKGNVASFPYKLTKDARNWVAAQNTASAAANDPTTDAPDEASVDVSSEPTANVPSKPADSADVNFLERIRRTFHTYITRRRQALEDVHTELLDIAQCCNNYSDWLNEIEQHGYSCTIRGNHILLRTPWHRFQRLKKFGLSADVIRKEFVAPSVALQTEHQREKEHEREKEYERTIDYSYTNTNFLNSQTKELYHTSLYDKTGRRRTTLELIFLLAETVLTSEPDVWNLDYVPDNRLNEPFFAKRDYKIQAMLDSITISRELDIDTPAELDQRVDAAGAELSRARKAYKTVEKTRDRMSTPHKAVVTYRKLQDLAERILAMPDGPEKEKMMARYAEELQQYRDATAVLYGYALSSEEKISDFEQRYRRVMKDVAELEERFDETKEAYQRLSKLQYNMQLAQNAQYCYGPNYNVDLNKKSNDGHKDEPKPALDTMIHNAEEIIPNPEPTANGSKERIKQEGRAL